MNSNQHADTHSEALASIRTMAMAFLAAQGWKVLDSVALAEKTFQTAVGPKTALVYLQNWGRASQSFILAGEYQSEGRNALEPHGVMVPKSSTPEQVSALVGRFAAQADAAVGSTYAMRLARQVA